MSKRPSKVGSYFLFETDVHYLRVFMCVHIYELVDGTIS